MMLRFGRVTGYRCFAICSGMKLDDRRAEADRGIELATVRLDEK